MKKNVIEARSGVQEDNGNCICISIARFDIFVWSNIWRLGRMSKHIVIFEGNEGTGKTTKAMELYHKLLDVDPDCVRYLHFGQESAEQDQYELYVNVVKENELFDNIIFDRCFISNLVYGPIMRNECNTCIVECQSIIDTWKSMGYDVTIFWCKCRDGYERAKKRGEEYVPSKRIYKELDDRYTFVMSNFYHIEVET